MLLRSYTPAVSDPAGREAVEAAGAEIWFPPHFEGPAVSAVDVDVVIPLTVGALAIGRSAGDVLITPIVVDGGARRAVPGDGVWTALLATLAHGGIDGLHAMRIATVVPLGGEERTMGVDQSNESVVIGERAVVKLYPRMAPGPQPGVDLPAHLAAVGFDAMPTPFGALTTDDGTLVATSAAFVPTARDGWEWYVGLVDDACRSGSWTEADHCASQLGRLVARLHRALATPSHVLPNPTERAGRTAVETWHRRAIDTLDEAVAATSGEAGDRLRANEAAARSVLDRLLEIDETSVQRIHGDLHVGQILRTEERLFVSDFDGDPLAPAGERTSRASAARDLASMTCALDHVSRVVAHRRSGANDPLAAWRERARDAFLEAYRRDASDLFDERLLSPFEVAQEAHEYVYAARYLPRWAYVPDAAMPAMLERAV